MSLEFWGVTTKKPEETWLDYEFRVINDGSGEASFSLEQSTAQCVYIVQWTSLPLFLDDLLGWAELSGTAGFLHRTIPEAHPLYQNFFAMNAKVSPARGQIAQGGYDLDFKKAIVTADFKGLTYDVIDDNEITTEMDRYVGYSEGATVDFLTTQGAMVFQQTGRNLATTPGRRVLAKEFVLTWMQVPANPDSKFTNPIGSTIDECLGRVNVSTFFGYKPGTVLFQKPEPVIAPPRLSADNIYWNIGLHFAVRDQGDSELYAGERIGWQYVFDQKANKWDKVRNPDSHAYTYETAELNNLFTV